MASRGTVRRVVQIGFGSSGHDMRVMFDVTNPLEREHTMTKRQDKSEAGEIKPLLTADGDFLRSVVAALEAEMTEALSAVRRR
jgi:hypothetical protein